ncbi:MAG: hypothetical protein KatS3mg081_0416 [Gemmatimonadales bacterium]|nr:Levansucrase [bacterium HR33]GIW51061.1 MAG: hypothetical protein KatS3mg081_0416 [Gemmatimonadales bacterium]
MNVRCPTCETIYRVDPAKVPEGGVKARCAVCSAVIPVSRTAEEGRPTAAFRAGGAAQAPAPTPPPRPSIGLHPERPAVPGAAPSAPVPPPRPTPQPARPPTPPRPSAPVFRPTPTPAAGPGAAQIPRPPVAPAASKAPAAKPPGTGAGASAGAAHINPFLAQDPKQKARRLARALISDMIVYQPEKRQKALKEGNLKEAFAEEIKKSWEEYVLQVGEELANSTTYFTDALNEILAGGQKIF